MGNMITKTKAKTSDNMNEDEFFQYSIDVLAAFDNFKKSCVRLKELNMLSSYRQYELDLFVQRNTHYSKEFENAIVKYKKKWNDSE